MAHTDLYDVLPEQSWLAVRSTINRMLMNGPVGIILGMERTDELIAQVVLAITAKHRALVRIAKRSLERGGICSDHTGKLKDGVCAECDLERATKIITHLLEDGSYDDDGDYVLVCEQHGDEPVDHPAMVKAREFIRHMMATRGDMGGLTLPQDHPDAVR